MNNITANLFDNATLEGELFEGLLQTLFWTYVLSIIRARLLSYCEKKPWFAVVEKGAGGTEEYISQLRASPQHAVAGIIALLGAYYNNGRLIRHATLAEFGLETMDILRVWYLYLSNQMDPKYANKRVFSSTFHHLPGIIGIIPFNICHGDNIHYQNICATLLAPASINIVLTSIAKTYDLNSKNEQRKFLLAYLSNITIFVIGRFVFFPIYTYRLFYWDYNNWTMFIKITSSGYFTCLTLFNFIIVYVLCERLQRKMTKGSVFLSGDEKMD